LILANFTPLQAFLDAIDAIGRQGTLLIPSGRYLIRKQLNINNRVVLRGERGIVMLHNKRGMWSTTCSWDVHATQGCYRQAASLHELLRFHSRMAACVASD
jgi:hypothetical protein